MSSSSSHPPTPTRFIHEPDPANPGWYRWDMEDQARFNPQVMGAMLLRTEAQDTTRLRIIPREHHANAIGTLHGAAILALVDIALFATAHTLCSADAAGAVTLDLDCRFIGAGEIGRPLDAVTQVLRETRRLVFLRGLVEQQGARQQGARQQGARQQGAERVGAEREGLLLASYSATIRKPSRP